MARATPDTAKSIGGWRSVQRRGLPVKKPADALPHTQFTARKSVLGKNLLHPARKFRGQRFHLKHRGWRKPQTQIAQGRNCFFSVSPVARDAFPVARDVFPMCRACRVYNVWRTWRVWRARPRSHARCRCGGGLFRKTRRFQP